MSEIRVNGNVELRGVAERRRRLNSMFRDFVKEKGRMRAARLLGVNYKTVARAHDAGRITDRLAEAMETLLENTDGAETAEKKVLEDRFQRLEEDVMELREIMGALRRLVESVGADGRGGERAERMGDKTLGGPGDTASDRIAPKDAEDMASDVVPPVEGLSARRRDVLRLRDPELVTETPAPEDPEVYGPAWPLVEEWRRLREGHPYQGKSLSWLVTQERILVLELGMLEEHGLTLPPEKQPLRGFGRRGQTSWRHTALNDTRIALHRRRMLRWVRRVLTLGLWRK